MVPFLPHSLGCSAQGWHYGNVRVQEPARKVCLEEGNAPKHSSKAFFALVYLQVSMSWESSSHPCSLGICGSSSLHLIIRNYQCSLHCSRRCKARVDFALSGGIISNIWGHLNPLELVNILITSYWRQLDKSRAVFSCSWIPKGPKSGWVELPGAFLGYLSKSRGLALEVGLSHPCLPLLFAGFMALMGQHKKSLTS